MTSHNNHILIQEVSLHPGCCPSSPEHAAVVQDPIQPVVWLVWMEHMLRHKVRFSIFVSILDSIEEGGASVTQW